MTDPSPVSATLQRRIGLRSAVAFNMLEMIGVGPFITLPLVIAAAGYRLSVWAWVLGAAIAVADGLVWAELGAAFPRAGGSYAFLREIYGPEGAGNWLSFLYVWQLSFSAPLSIASGCIGLSSFLGWFWPGLEAAPMAAWPALHYANFAAAAACLLVTALLYRNLSSITRLAWVLFAGVLAAIAGVIVSGFAHAAATGGWQMPASPALPATVALGGLAQAHAAGHLLLLGLLQHLLSGRRGEAAGADDSARDSAFGALRCGFLRDDESGRAAFACAMPLRMWRLARRCGCNWWRTLPSRPLDRWAGTADGGADRLDGLWLGLFAAAGLLARALRGGAGRQLLPLSGRRPSAARHSPPVAGGAGSGGGGVLLLFAGSR